MNQTRLRYPPHLGPTGRHQERQNQRQNYSRRLSSGSAGTDTGASADIASPETLPPGGTSSGTGTSNDNRHADMVYQLGQGRAVTMTPVTSPLLVRHASGASSYSSRSSFPRVNSWAFGSSADIDDDGGYDGRARMRAYERDDTAAQSIGKSFRDRVLELDRESVCSGLGQRDVASCGGMYTETGLGKGKQNRVQDEVNEHEARAATTITAPVASSFAVASRSSLDEIPEHPGPYAYEGRRRAQTQTHMRLLPALPVIEQQGSSGYRSEINRNRSFTVGPHGSPIPIPRRESSRYVTGGTRSGQKIQGILRNHQQYQQQQGYEQVVHQHGSKDYAHDSSPNRSNLTAKRRGLDVLVAKAKTATRVAKKGLKRALSSVKKTVRGTDGRANDDNNDNDDNDDDNDGVDNGASGPSRASRRGGGDETENGNDAGKAHNLKT